MLLVGDAAAVARRARNEETGQAQGEGAGTRRGLESLGALTNENLCRLQLCTIADPGVQVGDREELA